MSRFFLTLLFFSLFYLGIAQNNFQEIFFNTAILIKENTRLAINDVLGNQSHLPISIVKGKTDGLVFTIVAGVHGFEYPPIVATQELMQEIKAKDLSGIIIFIPIANTASFFTRTPFINPQDKTNLNGAFSGDSTVFDLSNQIYGSPIITEQLKRKDYHISKKESC